MPQYVSNDAKKFARTANLYDYLLAKHPYDVQQEYDSLRLCCNHSVSVRRGYCGYLDFALPYGSEGSKGNSIDCLVRFLGYEFTDAVAALCEFYGQPYSGSGPERRSISSVLRQQNQIPVQKPPEPQRNALQVPQLTTQAPRVIQPPRVFRPPEPVQDFRHLYDYLCGTRGLDMKLVRWLVRDGLIYQSNNSGYDNIVFMNLERTFYEIRGTAGKPYHQVGFTDPAAFWWFKPNGPTSQIWGTAYVCESAIDAISLHLIDAYLTEESYCEGDFPEPVENGLYCSIGGVANQQRIDAIKAGMKSIGGEVVIAVDNDEAGAACRARNSDCRAIIPKSKDWNEDYLDLINGYDGDDEDDEDEEEM